MLPDLLRVTLQHHLALGHEVHLLTDAPDDRQIVLHNHDRRALGRKQPDGLHHLYGQHIGQTRCGLVEQQEIGFGEQGGGQGAIRVLRWPLAENDRAHTEGEHDGLIKVLTSRRGRILGAGIVAPQAGELIQPWVLAIGQGLNIGAMAGLIAPYPTLGEIGKRAAGSYYAPKLFSERTRKLVRFLARFG